MTYAAYKVLAAIGFVIWAAFAMHLVYLKLKSWPE